MMLTIDNADMKRYKEIEVEINALQANMDELSTLSYMDKTPEILEQLLSMIRKRRKLEVEQSALRSRMR